ncbi:MAG TPA: hypothetical protein VE010_17955 [Thermoanaerobaculia bacterium]|nr:hypothetical protein [Thermoanaerobaculia bacterium]
MSTAPSPPTTLRDVVITNEQTRAEWRAGRASIDAGLIVVAASDLPPDAFLGTPSTTFTITALDGGDRSRRFTGVIWDEAASKPPKKYVFV